MGVKIREKPAGSGVWWVFINQDGKRRSKRIGPKREAQQVQKQVIQHLAAGDLGMLEKKAKAFKDYCSDWLNKWVPVHVKESTGQDYRAIVKNHLSFAPFFKRPVDQINKKHMQDFFDSKRRTLSASTTCHIKNACSSIFSRAVDDETINKNPCKGTKIARDEKKEFTAYTTAEVSQLLDAFKGNRYYTMILFFVRTGCRSSEVAALQWKDLNLTGRKATIRRGFVRGKIVESTKSHRAREIDLTPDLVAQLRQLRKDQLAAADQKSVWVFQNSAGNLIDMNSFRHRIYNKIVKKAGLRPSRLHDLRHTYASLLIDATGNMKYAQKQLGHHSIAITVDIYQHILDGDSGVRLVDVLDAPNPHPIRTQAEKEANQFV